MEVTKLDSKYFNEPLPVPSGRFLLSSGSQSLLSLGYHLEEGCFVEYEDILYKAYSVAVFTFFIEPI